MKPGDVYAIDTGDTDYLLLCDEGAVIIDNTGVYVLKCTVDSEYLHSVRAVPVGNLKEALCKSSLLT